MSEDIDWLAVSLVCEGSVVKLTAAEKRAVVRQLHHRMLDYGETSWGTNKLTLADVAERLQTTRRSVERYKQELTVCRAVRCPVCHATMWVDGGKVLPHPDSMMTECPMSGRQTLRGLAAIRPDLYEWVTA